MKAIYTKHDIEISALRNYLKNEQISFDESLIKKPEENNPADFVYDGLMYQITTEESEAEVHSRIINKREPSVKKGNIEGELVEIFPYKNPVPRFSAEYHPDDAWDKFVIKPITKKRLHDGKGIILIIFALDLMPHWINQVHFKDYRERIPENSYEKIVVVDAFKNFTLPKV
ncbi:MAG: hypothetical protein KGI49_03765 [Patescibacteria group bacterium]|nr:hypothetical protein [Patescibacteria group bacterium]